MHDPTSWPSGQRVWLRNKGAWIRRFPSEHLFSVCFSSFVLHFNAQLFHTSEMASSKQPKWSYEGCSNMNASSIITFFTYMLEQNGKRFYKGLYVTFKLVPDLKKNTVYLSSYSPLKEGHVSILTNPMLRT